MMIRRHVLTVLGLGAAGLLPACGGGSSSATDPAPAPAPLPNLAAQLQADPDLSTLVQALNASALQDSVAQAEALTVFAPTNEAFVLLQGELGVRADELLAATELLTRVLKYHLLAQRRLQADLPLDQDLPTLQGEPVRLLEGARLTDRLLRQARITRSDLLASNGVIHVIDRVLLPQNMVA